MLLKLGPIIIKDLTVNFLEFLVKEELKYNWPNPIVVFLESSIVNLVKNKYSIVRACKSIYKKSEEVTLKLKNQKMRSWYFIKLRQGLIHTKNPKLYNKLDYNDKVYINAF